ncbi:hypothetical protein V5N11_002316 [Cardamine amara subsp. amara]|uniref:NAC domain-containing protein n=1 Tax=Cardamine amara subsp. amara TaxID=228776 RepID=A0ABD0Z9Y3_CARAN
MRENFITCTIPEECHDIFSRHPRQLPGYPRQDHWYYYGRKRNNQVTANSHNLWTPIEEETCVFDVNNNGELVGIKRPFALIDKEEDSDFICFLDENEPSKYEWFMDDISLPLTVADTDWVFYYIFGEKIEPEFVDLPILESQSEDEQEEETVDI